MVGATHDTGDLLHVVHPRSPLGDVAVIVRGGKDWPGVLVGKRRATGNHQKGDILGEGLGYTGEGVLDSRPGLRCEDADGFAVGGPAVAVGYADTNPLRRHRMGRIPISAQDSISGLRG